jgi:hypothetical protein
LGDFKQEFEPETVSKSGKSTNLYKRLLLQRSRLQILVSNYVLVFTCILADRCCYRESSNRVNARKALHGIYRMTRAGSFLKFYIACPLALVGRQDQMLLKANILCEWSGHDEGKTRS